MKTHTEQNKGGKNKLFILSTRNDTSNGIYYMPKASSNKTIFSN